MPLLGAQEFRNRLAAAADSIVPMAENWAIEAAKLMQQRVHSPTGRLRASIRPYATPLGARIDGDYRLTFQDKGTKEHDISPRKGHKTLRFEYQQKTVFARKAHVRGVRKRPFIRKSSREALKANVMLAELIKAWNAGGVRTKKYVLGDVTSRRRRARRLKMKAAA